MLPPPVLVEPAERTMLRQSVSDFVAQSGKPALVRERRKTELGYDLSLWREMASLGWLQLAVPEERGGLGMKFADLVALHEEIGKGAIPEPLAAVAVLAAGALVAGNADEALLDSLMKGDLVAALAWQSRAGALSSADVEIGATRDGDGFRISGRASFVIGSTGADGFIVAARLANDVALFWIDASSAGLRLETTRLADYTPVAELILERVGVGGEKLLVGPERGGAILDSLLDRGRIAVSAETVGVMHQILSVTLDYLRTREQFGKPIGSFQALQHRAVDLYVQIELARSATLKAAAAVDRGGADIPLLAAAAKARSAEAAIAVAGQAIHLHGTIGFTEELDLSILLRRAHVLSAWLGNGEACRRRYAMLRWPEGIAA